MLLCCHIEYTPELIERAMQLSLPQRREKAQGMRNDKVQAASLTAGLLLRYGLHMHGVDNAEILTTDHGKPYLTNSGLFFSLSHSGEYAACAISEQAVGVDIQKIVDVSERVISRFCTKAEQKHLKNSNDPKRDTIRLWALKESWLKAAEKNTEEMFKADFLLHPDGKVSGPKGFCYTLYDNIPNYIVALCVSDII